MMAYELNDSATAAAVEVAVKLVSVESGKPLAVPLNKLHLSARNVRKVRDEASIPALAAMILASGGLLNPLAVVPEKTKSTKGATFGVVAGGRRLAALKWLVAHKKLAADAPVTCRVFGSERGVGVSLTENASQEAMHPVDQLEAFKQLVAEGKTVGQIAAAFGVSPLTVERRLKLANLAPVFLEMFRQGEIEQAQMQALALADDPGQQLAVWNSLPSYGRTAYHIAQMLTDEEVRASEPVARFVGLEAYREAGGAVRTDLFADEGGAFLQDGDLLNRLAIQKLEAKAEECREQGWKWAEARMSFSPYTGEFGRLLPEPREPSKDERKEFDRLESDRLAILERLDALEDAGQAQDGMDEQQEAEWRALDEQREALDEISEAMEAALQEWAPAARASAGVIVSFDREGRFALTEGLVRKEDRQQVAGVDALDLGSSKPKPRAEFSAKLCENLTAHRTVAVAAALTQQPKLALAGLLLTLIVHDREPWHGSPLSVRFTDNRNKIGKDAIEYEQSEAAAVMAAADARAEQLPKDGDALFEALQAMELPALVELLSVYVGRAYEVFSATPERTVARGFDMARLIERALKIDMADWWAPTAARFLNHVPKSKMIEAVTEACGAQAAQPLAAMKKADAVAAAAAALEGKRWLPSTLQPYVDSANADHEEPEDADDDMGDEA